MSEPVKIPEENNDSFTPDASPGVANLSFPSPIITKRMRSNSMSERLLMNPEHKGMVKYFSRSHGHGFIKPNDGGTDIFLHISDIDGEYVPKSGDEVAYRLCPIPPKMEKTQAVHVRIVNFCPSRHQRWTSPCEQDEDEAIPPTSSMPAMAD
ncbi:unnamed protein product [Notodromas monacha]|uniref:CSD domain-containing protein n=1 Tax=Notodromas monacha TaxID=399045 RepID=A0A7R9GEJ8_9CRUS|nr:unnamed protein product [Notodromas monacha]CAG0918352.1 unnamed protein product [Notodromas monacha]